MDKTHTIGIDYGTNSVRALIVRCSDGRELASAAASYPSGEDGILLDPRDPNLARQHPGDYPASLEKAVAEALAEAAADDPSFDVKSVIGIGVDATGSSPIPVDACNRPLAMKPEFRENLAAQCWLWKDHTSWEEAAWITEKAKAARPHYLAKCGGAYSSEWFWSKIWHCLRTAPDVFDAAASWVEFADWIPAVLCGADNPANVRRGICAAGHKALYSEEWGGLPDKEFLAELDPRLAQLRDDLYETAYDAGKPAGRLDPVWAQKLGLPEHIPVTIGELDVHYGAIGAGVAEGTLVKVIGTSTCDCCVVPLTQGVDDIPGICGIVAGSILPGFHGIEAGQSAVGDIFRWWVEEVCEGDSSLHDLLSEEAARLLPGESGLLALDWNNGNRNILADPRLTGLLLGQTLHTTRAEIYRALVESTAFGAKMIIDRIEEFGVEISRIVCAGGIAEKNPLLMQIYADVTGREMLISGSSQTCALGAAITASVLAGPDRGGHATFAGAQEAMTRLDERRYAPEPGASEVYARLFKLYQTLHDGFGRPGAADLGGLMKELLAIKAEASRHRETSRPAGAKFSGG